MLYHAHCGFVLILMKICESKVVELWLTMAFWIGWLEFWLSARKRNNKQFADTDCTYWRSFVAIASWFWCVPIIYCFTPPSVFFLSLHLFTFTPLWLRAIPNISMPPSTTSLPMHVSLYPPVSEEQVLTGSWHLVRQTTQRCVFAPRSGGHGRPMQVHYIIPIITDLTQDWGWSVLGSGWLGPAHMPSMREQMWSADPELSHYLFCLSAPQADHITTVPAHI